MSRSRLLAAFAIVCLTAFSPANVSSQQYVAPPPSCPDQIHYLSDEPNNPYGYLEALQREIYEAFPDVVDPFSRMELNKPRFTDTWGKLSETLAKQGCDENGQNCVGDAQLFRTLLDQIKCKPLPTRFESPLFTLAINMYMGQLTLIQQRHYPSARIARFGSLPTGTIDAQAVLPPGADSPIIILNRDVFHFTGAFSKAISDAIPIRVERGGVAIDHSEEAITRRLRENPHIVQNFADAMSRLVLSGSSKGAREVLLDANHNRLHARLVTAMDLFVVAHEKAHVTLNHVSASAATFRMMGAGSSATGPDKPTPKLDAGVPVQARSRQQELDADSLGFSLMVKAIDEKGSRNPVDLMVGVAAPHMIFRIMDAASTYSHAARGHSLSDSQHPSAAERVKALERVYDELARPNGPLNDLPDFRQAFDASLITLLKMADPLIRKAVGLPATE